MSAVFPFYFMLISGVKTAPGLIGPAPDCRVTVVVWFSPCTLVIVVVTVCICAWNHSPKEH